MSVDSIVFTQEQDNYSSNKVKWLKEFCSSLHHTIDGFYEQEFAFQQDSSFYYIVFEEEQVGFFLVNEMKKELYTYYITEQFNSNYNLRRPIFQRLIKTFQISSSILYSIDIELLNLLLDVQTGLECIGYAPFVHNSSKVQPAILSIDAESCYTLHTIENTAENQSILRDIIKEEVFFISEQEMIPLLQEQQLYFFKDKDTIIGVGILQHSLIQEHVCSVGMCIKQEFRRQGLGTLLLLQLQQKGSPKIVTSGCSVMNDASRRTIEKSFGILRGRVLKVTISNL